MVTYDDEDNEFDEAPPQFRKAYEKLKREHSKLAEQYEAASQKARASTLVEELASRNLNPKIAGLVPPDADVAEWLDSFGELFGGAEAPPVPADVEDVGPDPAVVEALKAQQQLEDPQGHVVDGDLISKINSTKSADELIELIQNAQKT